MPATLTTPPRIREEILRDPCFPVHKIADQLFPYLQVLVEDFLPEQVILFGSYAYGLPTEHSDIDLLVVKETTGSILQERRNILKAWRATRWAEKSLSIELLVVSPAWHEERILRKGTFYNTIIQKGIRLI